MSRGTKFVLFIVLLIIIAVVYLTIQGKDKFVAKYVHNSVLIASEDYEPISLGNVVVNLTNSDIYLSNSKDNKIHVRVYSQEGQEVLVKYTDYELLISEPKKYDCEGICLGNKTEIEIPDNYYPTIKLTLTSGDTKSLLTNNIVYYINVTSGDVNLGNTHSSIIKTTSGNINIDYVLDYIDIESTSGDVYIKEFDATADSNIRVTSGDVEIHNFEGAKVNSYSRSGDIRVQDDVSENTVTIRTTSGDIIVKKH